MAEIWDLYDDIRNNINKCHERGIPVKLGEYHIVVGVWVVSFCNQILVTKRHPDKPWGNYWECTGGSVLAGESSVSCAMRELREETGISVNENNLYCLGTKKYDNWFTDSFVTFVDKEVINIDMQIDEVVEYKWVSTDTLCSMCSEETVVPFVKEQYYSYKSQIEDLSLRFLPRTPST